MFNLQCHLVAIYNLLHSQIQYRAAGWVKEIQKIGSAVNATCQGNLSTCHRFPSPALRVHSPDGKCRILHVRLIKVTNKLMPTTLVMGLLGKNISHCCKLLSLCKYSLEETYAELQCVCVCVRACEQRSVDYNSAGQCHQIT